MDSVSTTYLIAICAAVFGLAAFTAFILVPAWNSYSKSWERVAATLLSLYVLVALLGVGAGIGVAVVWFWI